MKILKIKSILCSLMAIAMLTVFLSSCKKETQTQSNTNKLIVEKEKKFIESLDNYSKDGLQLIGYQTVQIDEQSIEGFTTILSNTTRRST